MLPNMGVLRDRIMDWIIERLEAEWQMIRQAPLSFALAVLISSGLIGWWIWEHISQHYEEKLSGQKETYENRLAAQEEAHEETTSIQRATIESKEERITKLREEIERIREGKKDSQQAQRREIKKEDRGNFIRTLSSSEKYVVNLGYANGDPEALALARDIAELMNVSGWKIKRFSTDTIIGGPPSGVTIWVDEGKSIPSGASLLLSVLTDQNIKTRIKKRSSFNDPLVSFRVFIGPRF